MSEQLRGDLEASAPESIRRDWTPLQAEMVAELFRVLRHFSRGQLANVFGMVLQLLRTYRVAYQLSGDLALVLDNSVIQDFKHRGDRRQPKRAIRAIAFTIFCRFVQHWSDRDSSLVVPAVAIYEHLGRRAPKDEEEALAVLDELALMLADLRLPLRSLGYDSALKLVDVLHAVHRDAAYLTGLAQELQSRSWKKDLKAEVGVKLPISLAHRELPEELSVEYFSPHYVRMAFAARIEHSIIKQSGHEPTAMPIGSGPVGQKLAKLNGIERDIRRGNIKGLGDLELLQYCHIGAQYKRPSNVVLVAQTFDDDLSAILSELSMLVHSEEPIHLESPEAADRVADTLARYFRGLPFKDEAARTGRVAQMADSFVLALADACERVLMDRVPK